MDIVFKFKSLENRTTGENLIKIDTVKVIEFSKDSLELEFKKHHSISVGNLIMMEISVSYQNQIINLSIIGKVTENQIDGVEEVFLKVNRFPKWASKKASNDNGITSINDVEEIDNNSRFILKLVQYNIEIWMQVLKLFEARQEAVTTLFKHLRGR